MELQTNPTSIENKSLTILTKATQMLAEVKTLVDAKNLMDVAAAAKMYAHKHHLGKEAVQHATEIEIQAEIMMGEYLREMEKNRGGRRFETTGTPEGPVEKTCRTERQVSEPPTYEEIGITKNEASEAQSLANLSNEQKEQVVKGKKSKKAAVKESKQKKSATSKPRKSSTPIDRFHKRASAIKKDKPEDLVSDEFREGFNAFLTEIKNAKALKWRTTSKEAALQYIKILYDVITIS